jgi:hypothetical protein
MWVNWSSRKRLFGGGPKIQLGGYFDDLRNKMTY